MKLRKRKLLLFFNVIGIISLLSSCQQKAHFVIRNKTLDSMTQVHIVVNPNDSVATYESGYVDVPPKSEAEIFVPIADGTYHQGYKFCFIRNGKQKADNYTLWTTTVPIEATFLFEQRGDTTFWSAYKLR